jgi:streptogramin lyase
LSFHAAFAVGDDRLLLTTSNGPGYLDPLTGNWLPFHPLPDRPYALMAARAVTDRHAIWTYAPQTQTLWHYTPAGGEPERADIDSPLPVRRLLPFVDDGALWFEARNALLKLDVDTRWLHTYLPSTAAFIDGTIQKPGVIWTIKDGHTLVRFDTQTETLTVHPIPFGTSWQHLASTGNVIWLGGESSQLLAFEPGRRRWQEIALQPTCVGTVIYALAAGKGAVWAGGENGALRYDPVSRQQTCYTTERGMLNDRVEQIILLGDWAWFTHSWYGLWGYGPPNEGSQ